nr:reverse transcriptase domain-containing protein, chloroplastic [Tanacetum cinerariifolium]
MVSSINDVLVSLVGTVLGERKSRKGQNQDETGQKQEARVVPKNYDPKGERFLIASRFSTPPLACAFFSPGATVTFDDQVCECQYCLHYTIANPRSDLKAITTRSGVSYDGPPIPPPPSFLPPVVENEPEATKDTVNPTNNGNTEDVQPQAAHPKPVTSPISEPTITPVSMAECLALADLGASINLMPYSVWKRLSLSELTPTCMTLELADRSITSPVGIAEDVYVKVDRKSSNRCVRIDFLLEEVDAFLAVEDEPTSSEFYQPYLDPEGDILLLEAFLNDDPLPPPYQGNYMPEVRKELKICEAHSEKSSVDKPHVAGLKDLPPHLEYAFLEGDDKLPVIMAKDLSVEEKTALITILKSHKRAMTWKLSDIKGINPEFCTHKILMEEDFKPVVQHQRRVNPKIYDVIKQ